MSKFLLPLALSLTGCAMEEAPTTDTTDGGSAGGGYYENLPGNSGDGGSDGDGGGTASDGGNTSDGGTTDGGSGDGGSTEDGGTDDGGGSSDGGTDGGDADGGSTSDGGTTDGGSADGGSSEPTTVTAMLGFFPETTWDVSVTSPSTANPTFYLWLTANVTTAAWAGYGGGYVDSTPSNGWVEVFVTYTPGDILAVNGNWDDGVRDRYLAEAGGVVNILTSDGCDHPRLVISLDGYNQVYSIVGDYPDEGEAGWVSNGSGGGDLYVATYSHTDTVTDGCP